MQSPHIWSLPLPLTLASLSWETQLPRQFLLCLCIASPQTQSPLSIITTGTHKRASSHSKVRPFTPTTVPTTLVVHHQLRTHHALLPPPNKQAHHNSGPNLLIMLRGERLPQPPRSSTIAALRRPPLKAVPARQPLVQLLRSALAHDGAGSTRQILAHPRCRLCLGLRLAGTALAVLPRRGHVCVGRVGKGRRGNTAARLACQRLAIQAMGCSTEAA